MSHESDDVTAVMRVWRAVTQHRNCASPDACPQIYSIWNMNQFDYQIYYIKYAMDNTTVGLQNEGGNTQICQSEHLGAQFG